MSYYNTTNESGADLKEYTAKTEKQEVIVKRFFNANPLTPYTAWEVLRAVFPDRTPITSVRRTMTNLTSEGFLTKTSEKKRGPLGRPGYKWIKA